MVVRDVACASCKSFPLADAVEAGGEALCGSFDRGEKWNNRACILYERAGDINARKSMVIQLSKAARD